MTESLIETGPSESSLGLHCGRCQVYGDLQVKHGRVAGAQVYTGSTNGADVYKSLFQKVRESKPQGIRTSCPLGQLLPLQAYGQGELAL